MMHILVFGEVLFDCIEGQSHLGGAPLNFAVNAQRLGANPSFISALGADELGRRAQKEMEALGLNLKGVQIKTSLATAWVDVHLEAGNAKYTIHPNVAFDSIAIEALPNTLSAQSFELFYFGSLAQRSKESRETLAYLLQNIRFKEVFFDCNLRQDFYNLEIIKASLQAASIFKMNEEELPIISQLIYQRVFPENECCTALAQDFNLHTIILTEGSKGCRIFQSEAIHQVAAIPVEVVDTIGAGDAFCAAYAVSFLNGKTAVQSAQAGSVLGSYVAGKRAALPNLPKDLLLSLK